MRKNLPCPRAATAAPEWAVCTKISRIGKTKNARENAGVFYFECQGNNFRLQVNYAPTHQKGISMGPDTEKMLSRIRQRIIDEFAPERIILFGSHAKGKNTENSDLDLLIIESEPFTNGRSRRQEASRIWKAFSEFDVPKDILVYCHDEVERWKSSLNHIIACALREGLTLYVRP
jgi:uncharacterized protein